VTLVRFLRTAKATLSKTFSLDEVGTDPAGSVSVSIARLDGSIVQSGSATSTGTPGQVSFTFTGRDVLDELTLSWSATIGGDDIVLDQDRIQVVGGFYFGLSEARASDPVLQNTTKFPTAMLVEDRIEVEDECERITGQAWVPRFCRETVYGTGRQVLQLSHPLVRAVRSVTGDGLPVSAPTFNPLGLLRRPAGWTDGAAYVVEYEHGHDNPNTSIVRAAKQRLKSLLLEGKSALPDRAERVITVDQTGGSVVYGQPTAEKTGIPGVDAVYLRYPPPQPGFG
jgi:hypothetical protein